MAARILNGTAIAAAIRDAARSRVDDFTRSAGRAPGLGIVLVGDMAASELYVRNKLRAAEDLGIWADLQRLPADASVESLLDLVQRLNRSEPHDGILVQAPLPAAMGRGAADVVFEAIAPGKDVDGFNPINVGRLVRGRHRLAPCTPSGIIELLDRCGIPIRGRHAVVLGRSDIVGKPMALMLLQRDATVTICHSRTPDLARVAASGDLLISAIGRPGFVTPEFVRPGATVVDVGINRVTDAAMVAQLFGPDAERRAAFARRGSIVVGDVHPAVAEVAGALTPVPGGVGPLTIACLITNTLVAAEDRRSGISPTN